MDENYQGKETPDLNRTYNSTTKTQPLNWHWGRKRTKGWDRWRRTWL